MGTTLNLGRVAGIRVGVHWSVLAIWWLLTWSLATGLLPDQTGGYSPSAYWLSAGAAAVALLGCLLAHELSHALVAARNDVTTEAITLWVFGGVAQLRDEADSPRTELAISAAGPAASLALAAAFGVVRVVFDLLGAPDLLLATVGWLAVVNVVLAVFNVLPGIPLDGGRMLQAALWWWTGDRQRATRTAAGVGKVLGYGLILLGLLEFTAGYWDGLWFVFLGWFLLSAATAEGAMTGLRQQLEHVTVAEVMTPDPDLAPDWVSVQALLDDYVLRYRHSSFPVHDPGGQLTGLVTLSRVKTIPPASRQATPVSSIAIPLDRLTRAEPDEPIAELLSRLASGRERRALVFDRRQPGADRLVGIVTPTDIARMADVFGLARAG